MAVLTDSHVAGFPTMSDPAAAPRQNSALDQARLDQSSRQSERPMEALITPPVAAVISLSSPQTYNGVEAMPAVRTLTVPAAHALDSSTRVYALSRGAG
jgi:hypothetical protein